jgi:hypothetical protein
MNYLEYIFGGGLGRLLAIGSVRKATYCGIGVGGVVGVTIALVKGYWPVILIGFGIGLVLGISLGLIIRAVRIMRGSDQKKEDEVVEVKEGEDERTHSSDSQKEMDNRL